MLWEIPYQYSLSYSFLMIISPLVSTTSVGRDGYHCPIPWCDLECPSFEPESLCTLFISTQCPWLRAMALLWWQNCRSLHGSMLLSEGKNENICSEIQCGVVLGPRGPNECLRPGEVSSTLVIPTTAITLLGMNTELLNSICPDVPDNLEKMLNASDNSSLTRLGRDLTELSPLHHPFSDPQEAQVTRVSFSLSCPPIIPHLPT